MKLTHVDKRGHAKMVAITDKKVTKRIATARGEIRTTSEVIRLIKANKLAKGDVFAVARVAGIQAAKGTSSLIPLCHPLALTHVAIDIRITGAKGISVESKVTCVAKTGPDVEAMVSAVATCLAIYDMCKAVDRAMTIEKIYLQEKSGGKSGRYKR